ncbi:MAG: cytochrome c [Elusimicrobia bacterium]|nr:cytochrome c [Elusimicrobiota bacterium]
MAVAVIGAIRAVAADADKPGQKTYGAKCASCHGKDGKGNAAMAKMFKVTPAALDLVDKDTQGKKDEELFKLTSEGKGKMPAFKSKLSEAEIKDVLSYIRTLAPADSEKPKE